MQTSFFTRHPYLKDVLNFIGFVFLVFLGTLLINTFIFRSFAVSGHSMDPTLGDGQRLIVNRIPITQSQLANKPYMPERGQIIVFKNPRFVEGRPDEYIVKRVIAFPNERVTINDGVLRVYNAQYPDGHVYDDVYRTNGVGPLSPSSHDGIDMTVPDSAVFVAGDNRIGDNSYDSRAGLGFIPTFDIVGPVAIRIFPFTDIRTF